MLKMFNQQRGIFKPTLKRHNLPSSVDYKKYSFKHENIQQQADAYSQKAKHQQQDSNLIQYPSMLKGQTFRNSNNISNRATDNIHYQHQRQFYQLINQGQGGIKKLTVNKFDPILPKMIFKRLFYNSETHRNHIKHANNQIIQELRLKNINYPFEVHQLLKQTQQNKISYLRIQNQNKSPDQQKSNQMREQNDNKWLENSYYQSLSINFKKGIRKIPYFPLMGMNGSIFWSHSYDKIILWRYKQNFQHPQVFCILNLQKQLAPISAVYATQIKSSLFKNQRTLLISVGFVNQMKFFIFDIVKYQKQYKMQSNDLRTQNDFRNYIQTLLIKVTARFIIQKIYVENITNHFTQNHSTRPLIIFTDGGQDLEIVDLQNLQAFKTSSPFDPFGMQKRYQQNKGQNQIVKILHSVEQNNPLIHYAFVLKKQTTYRHIKAKNLYEKLKTFIYSNKKIQKHEQIVISIYEWNQGELKKDSLWKKLFSQQRLKKIKQLKSKQLENKIKHNFFQFYKLNVNNQFFIADISLVQKHNNFKIFNNNNLYRQNQRGHNLKITFTNGCSIQISNFKILQLSGKIKVNSYIQKNIPITGIQYNNYRRLVDKGKYLLSGEQAKNKYNCYIYEGNEPQKQAKYCSIDPVISQCNDLNVCQNKLIYQNQTQILYKFVQSDSRKRIFELNQGSRNQTNDEMIHKKFVIFQNNHITLVQTPNIAENLIVLIYLKFKYPNSQNNVKQYINGIFSSYCQQTKIQVTWSIINLLIQISKSGKITNTCLIQGQGLHSLQNLQSPNNISKGIYNLKQNYLQSRKFRNNKNSIDNDQTTYMETYIEENDVIKNKQQEIFIYKQQVDKKSYINIVEYLFGEQICKKELQFLRYNNASFNGKSFYINTTTKIYNYLFKILIDQGLLHTQKALKQNKSRNSTVNNLQDLLQNIIQSYQKNTKYLSNLFNSMEQFNQTFLSCAISKYIINIIGPIFKVPYCQFRNLKSRSIKVIQSLQDIQSLIKRLIEELSFRSKSSIMYEQTILFCKSIQNSLPKIVLLIKLFDALSQVQYFNVQIRKRNETYAQQICLRNIIFKVQTKYMLQRLTVESLFDQNSILLDQIQEKLPQLHDIRNYRYFIGWKKINKNIIDCYQNKKTKQIKQSNQRKGAIFNWFGNNGQKTSFTNNASKQMITQKQYFDKKKTIQATKQQYFLIEKALSLYSYEDFMKYFTVKKKYSEFVQIVLNKISYLQKLYLQLKNKHNFDSQEFYNFNNLSKQKNISQNRQHLNQNSKLNQNSQYKSFIQYQQKVFDHQNSLKIESNIQYLNQKLALFIINLLDNYMRLNENIKNELCNLNSQSRPKNLCLDQRFKGTNSYKSIIESFNQQYSDLTRQLEDILSCTEFKCSKYLKRQLLTKLQSNLIYQSLLLKGNKIFNIKSVNQAFLSGKNQSINNQTFLLENMNQFSGRNQQIISGFIGQEKRKMKLQKIDQRYQNLQNSEGLLNLNQNWMLRRHQGSNPFSFYKQKQPQLSLNKQ